LQKEVNAGNLLSLEATLAAYPKVEQVAGNVPIAPGQSGQGSVSCPAGTLLVGGGFDGSWDPHLLITGSWPLGSNGWQVSGENTYPTTVETVLNIAPYAECLTEAPNLSTKVISAQVTVAPGQTGDADILCATSMGQLTDGGFQTTGSQDDIWLDTTYGEDWKIEDFNPSNSTSVATDYAVCLAGAGFYGYLSLPVLNGFDNAPDNSMNKPDSASQHNTVSASCPAGSLMTGGGYFTATNSGTGFDNRITSSWPENSSASWKSIAGGGFVEDSTAVCLVLPLLGASSQATATPWFNPPIFISNENAFCRSGPGPLYSQVSLAMSATPYSIVGRNLDSTYYDIRVSSQAECWVLGSVGLTEGSVVALPVMIIPPTATSTPPPNCPQYKTSLTCTSQPSCKWVPIVGATGTCQHK
jgi:hypothetical protein